MLEEHVLLAVRHCLFSIRSCRPYLKAISSIQGPTKWGLGSDSGFSEPALKEFNITH